ncbi:Vms1/Ankzf1 family peptidyl-tRNA hydrolase [Solwaraspora sp. WMMD406]|uniref:baeRF2 domain-containing protein n=1 Tax=Solwaraspora sp. WMMD406 TaxID=3016095 RepID=UPI002415FAED|nr:Vms1/Ankzf1 family peptidyl-tRNA hydrolase [Solwaraspora sp. WMMD406]MDG4766855.1 Vms1/Ankzf1 family peptidyl-tRNA hydrolase [Solwaraspora sp. WMMD406]
MTSTQVRTTVAELAHADGPFVSLYLDTSGQSADTARQVELRWRAARRRLADDGAPEDLLDQIEPLTTRSHPDGDTLVVLADATGVRVARQLPDAPPREVARYGPVPHLLPLLRWDQRQLPVLVVATDRTGAELVAMRPDGDEITESVTGETLHITRSHPGGWSQRRFQQRAEDRWEANATLVADRLADLVDELRPRVIVVTGDVRAVQFLRDKAPSRVADLLHEVQGAYDTTDAAVEQAVEVVRRLADADVAEAVDAYQRERGQADRATGGASDTLATLARHQVATLMLVDDPDLLERPAYAGDRPDQVGTTSAEVNALGATDPVRASLGDVATRAALAGGAQVLSVPADLADQVPDGIGAILRYTT